MDAKLDEYLKDAEESLRVTIDAVERLRNECEAQKAGEQGSAHGRIDLYLLPHLNTWLYSDSQIGSLRDLREELERGWTWLHREMTGQTEFNEDGSLKAAEDLPEMPFCDHPDDRVEDGFCNDCGEMAIEEINEDGHGFHTPRGDWPDRPTNPDDHDPPGNQHTHPDWSDPDELFDPDEGDDPFPEARRMSKLDDS